MASVGDVISLVETLGKMVTDIVQAKEEVKNLPEKTEALVRQVTFAGRSLKSLEGHVEQSDPQKVGLLRSILDDLGKELVQAHEKLEKFQRKSAHAANGNFSWETVKAYFNRGAAKLNKETNEITEDIRKLLVDLNQAIGLETHAIGVETRAVLQRLAQERGNVDIARQQYPVVLKLDELGLYCVDDDVCKVELMIADSHSNDFRVPSAEERILVSCSEQQQDNRRGAREGGIEIGNFTKIQLQISIEDDERFLNVVIFDNQRNDPPALFFPKTQRDKCKLSCEFKRQFPNSVYKSDPLSFKLEKDASLPQNAVAQQSVYVVLTTEQLEPLQDGVKILKLEDLEKHLDNEDVFVKRLLFDIK